MSSPRFSSEVPWWKYFPENPKLNRKPGTSCWIRCCVAKIACRHKKSIKITSLQTHNTHWLTARDVASWPSIKFWRAKILVTFIHNTFFPFQYLHHTPEQHSVTITTGTPICSKTSDQTHYTTCHDKTKAWYLVKGFNTFAPVSEHAWYSYFVQAATSDNSQVRTQ